MSVCLVLCDPGDTGDTGTFRVYSQAQLRTSHRHQRWQTCLFGDFQFIHVAFLSHVPAGWNVFFWVIPPMIITFSVVRYLVCTRWCSYEKLTSLFAMEEKAQGFAELS